DLYAQALALTEASDDHAQAFVSALSWLPPASTTAPREHLIRASGTHQRHLGLRAALALREDVGPLLPKALDDDDGSLRRIALRAAGLLGRTDLLRTLEGHRESATSDEAFLAAWSGGRMGDHDAVLALLDGIRTHAPRTGDALDVVVRRLEVPDAQDLVRHLMGQDDRQRDAIMATGILGDPAAIPWLIDRFEDLSTARLAGDAFSLITGADLVDLNLDRDPPEDVESGPTDDPDDDDVDMDADDTLPWPDRDRIAAWWSAEQGTFTKGVRHLLGSPIDAVSARDALLRGTQRQRSAAALELAILLPNRPVFNTALPARTQRAQLASRTAL
ncbi:MAG: TIGR02270 family protein, partial [Bacteroidota bacterium]